MPHYRILKALLALLAGAVPVILYAYAEGPDAGLSGVPGENDCTACHSGGPNTGNVKVGFPGNLSYAPGVKQHLVVTVADPNQIRWGFQLTARQSNSSSSQAGTFAPGTDGYTQIVCTQTTFQTESFGTCDSTMPLQYIEHTWNGTRYGQAGGATFEFDWTPPSMNVGSIGVYVAGNAANGDGSTGGDSIYLQSYTLTPASANVPTINSGGVVNGASFKSGIAPGSWVSILGKDLANSTRTWRADEIVNGKLPTQLDGVSVSINGPAAYVSYISPTQINVQAPSDSTTGEVPVKVTNNGTTSGTVTAQLQPVAPALFTWGPKYAVALRPDYSLVVSPGLIAGVTRSPAKPGDVVILWGTGFGPTVPTVQAGEETPATPLHYLATPPTVLIGNIQATVINAALSPGFAGLYQMAIQVPDVSNGDQPVVLKFPGGVQSPDGVYLWVQQ